MDIEKLNKSQIVLLTLLVSFVTSIATGIVTVSLMEQAPGAVTQTVNRIVERTVEKVAPEQVVAAVSAGTQTETIVIRESDLFSTAVEMIAPSIVRLFVMGKDEAGNDAKLFIGHGIVTEESGIIIADAGTPDGTIIVLRPDGTEVTANVLSRFEGASLVRLQAATTRADGEKLSWKKAQLTARDGSPGKAVIVLGGRNTLKIAQGIITGSVGETGIIETDIPLELFAAGSPLINADGEIIAVATRESRAATVGGFLASSKILLQNKGSGAGESTP